VNLWHVDNRGWIFFCQHSFLWWFQPAPQKIGPLGTIWAGAWEHRKEWVEGLLVPSPTLATSMYKPLQPQRPKGRGVPRKYFKKLCSKGENKPRHDWETKVFQKLGKAHILKVSFLRRTSDQERKRTQTLSQNVVYWGKFSKKYSKVRHCLPWDLKNKFWYNSRWLVFRIFWI